ncbi:hypothetical protein EKO04_004634 [Ascochyta lentis]|uniref:Uncharacterized protein n=1 Tax=Ascochyta lentis TaxID=205686 RepID=A0A8H7MJS2_9PLEO|nr:hypothetical protein EKO04_004634 [Ascochyta lentis]
MSDNADEYAKALKALHGAPVLKKQYDDIFKKARRAGLLEAVFSSLIQSGNDQSVLTSPVVELYPRNSSKRVPGRIPSTSSSRGLSAARGYGNTPRRQKNTPVNTPLRQVRKSPKVLVPVRKPDQTRQIPRRTQGRANTLSQALLWRDFSLLAEDSSPERQLSNGEAPIDELSGDELQLDAPKPTKPAPSKKQTPAKPGRKAKSAKPARRARPTPPTPLEHIDWVFWIQADEVGYWKPLSEFPCPVAISFERNFNTEFLSKPHHIKYYLRMLKSRARVLGRDICVGNATYGNRNTPSKWRRTGGDREKTCDTCFKRGRFCARLVRSGRGVQLGVYPLPGAERMDLGCEAMRYWARDV